MILVLVLGLLAQASSVQGCPICDYVTDIRDCTHLDCPQSEICQFSVKHSKLKSGCVASYKCALLIGGRSCGSHPGYFLPDDSECTECCHGGNCTDYAIRNIIPNLFLSCPHCQHEWDAQTCFDSMRPCAHSDHVCKLTTDGYKYNASCENKCTEELQTKSAGGCLNQYGEKEDCISCCTDDQCIKEALDLPFDTTSMPHAVTTKRQTSHPITLVTCQDDEHFPCNPSSCFVLDIARKMCPKLCGLCPTSSTTSATHTASYPPTTLMHTAAAHTTSSPPTTLMHTAEPCRDQPYPCNEVQLVCADPNKARTMCPYTCGLCPTTSRPGTHPSVTEKPTTTISSAQRHTSTSPTITKQESTTFSSVPYNTESHTKCQDDPTFTCQRAYCLVDDLAVRLCPAFCNRCPGSAAITTSKAGATSKVTVTLGISTTTSGPTSKQSSFTSKERVTSDKYLSTTYVPTTTPQSETSKETVALDKMTSTKTNVPTTPIPIISTMTSGAHTEHSTSISTKESVVTAKISTNDLATSTQNTATTTIANPTSQSSTGVSITSGSIAVTENTALTMTSTPRIAENLTATPFSVTTTETATTKVHHTRMCYQCGDATKGTYCQGIEAILPPLKPCPGGLSYCMTEIHLSMADTAKYIRRCVDKKTCHKDWWQATSDVSLCVDSDPTLTHTIQTCSYCCTEDKCNTGKIPSQETLYSE